MDRKPAYEELEKRVKELETELLNSEHRKPTDDLHTSLKRFQALKIGRAHV